MDDKEFKTWLTELQQHKLPTWYELPDLLLYKDQVVSLVEKYVSPYSSGEEKLITPAMINNYVKLKILPKPDSKKRYDRRHLAFLIAITLLKSVFPIQMIKDTMAIQISIEGERLAYDHFCQCVTQAVDICCQQYLNNESQLVVDNANSFLTFGSYAFANKLIAMKYVQFNSGLLESCKAHE